MSEVWVLQLFHMRPEPGVFQHCVRLKPHDSDADTHQKHDVLCIKQAHTKTIVLEGNQTVIKDNSGKCSSPLVILFWVGSYREYIPLRDLTQISQSGSINLLSWTKGPFKPK